MDYSKITLGELLSSDNQAIRRNATGILKQLQKCLHFPAIGVKRETNENGELWEFVCNRCGACWTETKKDGKTILGP